jgi:hypothetical protein
MGEAHSNGLWRLGVRRLADRIVVQASRLQVQPRRPHHDGELNNLPLLTTNKCCAHGRGEVGGPAHPHRSHNRCDAVTCRRLRKLTSCAAASLRAIRAKVAPRATESR